MQSFTTALIFLFCLVSARASILKGFTRKEVPSLDDIPNIAAQVRRLSAGRRDSTQALGERALKGGSKSKSKSNDKSNNDDAKDESDEPNEQQNQNGDEQVFPYIPEAPPEFSEAGELSFVIVSV